MPLFMDIHKLEGATCDALAKAHLADLEVQERHHVRYLSYWFNEQAGKAFCLVEAPTPEAAIAVHREAHGLVADEIIEVEARAVQAFLGQSEQGSTGAALQAGGGVLDTGFRTILFTDMEGSTTITQHLGDAEALKLLRGHDAIIRDALAPRGGREIKHTGDGIMAAFLSASSAVDCAIAIQRARSTVTTRATSGNPSTFESASVLANRWRTTPTYLAHRSSLRHGLVQRRGLSRFWCQTSSQSFA